jgi:eukaryotic-like serine/threonine-protein kinase
MTDAADSDAFADSLVGMQIGDRYVVSRILGKGGMGVVALASYAELEQQVAIKLMFPQHAANTTLNARFLREAKLAAKVRSPHLVRVSDVGKLPTGVPYFVMELLSGHDLGVELENRGPMAISDAVDFLLQAMTGIAELHAQGIVHRDLKPSNLFLTEAGGLQTVKVVDFGISKESVVGSSSSLTATENVLGTPTYMSPEQIKNAKEVDVRADVWGLGIILYQLLTDEVPFEAESDSIGELFGMILFSPPVPPRTRRPDLPEELEAVILRCLRRERDERYATVAELAEALRPFAPAQATPRIAAIQRILSAEPGPRPSEKRIATADVATAAEPKNGAGLPSNVVVPSSSGRLSDDSMLGETSTSEKAAISVREPGRSLATSTRSVSEPPTSVKRWVWVAAILLTAVGFVGVGVVVLRPPRAAPEVVAQPSATPAPMPDPLPSASAVATEIPAPPPPSATAEARPLVTRHVGAKPAAKPTASIAPSAVPPPTRPPAKTEDLIQDRK